MKTFGHSRSWTDYRDILARDFNIRFACEPLERAADVRGHVIRYDEWLPSNEPLGSLILVHGAGGNGRILAPCVLPALGAGWRVLAPDLPGYGLSEPAPGFDWDYREWPAVIAALAERQETPVVLMGLSIGGMTAVRAAQASATVRGVIATTLIDLSDAETFVRAARWRWLGAWSLWMMRVAPRLFDRLVVPLSLVTPLKAMSDAPRMQAYFKRDKLIGAKWVRARFFRTLHQHRLASFKLGCPLLLVHPGADKWTPTSLSVRVFERFDGPTHFIELSNGSHLPCERPAFDELSRALQQFLGDTADAFRNRHADPR